MYRPACKNPKKWAHSGDTKRPTHHPQLQHATCGHCTAVAQPLMCRCHRQRALWSRATDTSRAPAPDRPIRTPPHAPIGLHARCLAADSGSLTHSPARTEVARAAGLGRDGARASAATRRSFDWSARARRADRSSSPTRIRPRRRGCRAPRQTRACFEHPLTIQSTRHQMKLVGNRCKVYATYLCNKHGVGTST
jgi:hypothetical protein